MSNNVFEILQFYSDSRTFALGARLAISDAQKKIIHNAANRLWTIARECEGQEEKVPDTHVMEAAFRKFKSNFRNLDANVFSTREVRALIYGMCQFNDDDMYPAMSKLLERTWKDRYFNSLLFFLLSSWDSVASHNLQPVIDIFQNKLKSYQGKRDKYLLLKQNSRFLNLNGAELLGITLRKQDIGQKDSCSILIAPSVYFGLAGNRIDLEYYSRVIAAYFDRDAIHKLDLLKEVLKVHNYDATAKRIIPPMIIQSNGSVDAESQDCIRAIAIGMIGNPENASLWTMVNGSAEEKSNLSEAREILNEWLKKKFLTIFFEKCVHEPSRQKYWIDHIDMIDDLQIWTTPYTMSVLKSDNRISDMIDAKVKVLGYEKNVDMSVLIMSIANYYFIEFSDVGCLYMLRKGSPYGQIINSSRFLYFSEIKKMKVNLIQDFFLTNTEGKIDHRSGWETTLEKWMKYQRIIS